MQRVLSFPPPSRGFGDPSEFVSKRMCFSFMFSLGFLAFLGGFLLGRFVFDQELELSRTKLKKAHLHHQQVFGVYKNYSQFNASNILEGVSESAIQGHLALLTNDSGIDPASRSHREAEILQNHLRANGFDTVSPLEETLMHLSYPSSRFPNKAFVMDEGNNVVLECNDTRERYSGTLPRDPPVTSVVEGSIVYVNFGRNEDYHFLDTLGVTVTGHIVLVRAGRILPTEMVNNALDHEAKGILMYLDPQQKDVKLPLLSPGIGNIPLLEISPGDAEKIFKKMSANESSAESWRGKLKCVYPIGPGFSDPTWKVRMEVSTVNLAQTYFDVLGTIRGSQEPDRFVMLANERRPADNEVRSTSVIMEVVRVLGELRGKGWRPHRSIVVAFWGMEGPNQHLSSQPEGLLSQIITKTVAYLEVDSGYQTGSDRSVAVLTPILDKLFHKSARAVPLTEPSADLMLPLATENLFIHYGIPFIAMEKFSTKENATLREVAAFWGVTTWNLAESHGLPFSVESYSKFFAHSVEVMEKRFKTIAQKHSLFLDVLFQSVQQLIDAIRSFEEKWAHADKSKSIEMRIMNDQLLVFTRSLICNRDQSPSKNILNSGHSIFYKSLTGNDEKAGFGELQDLLREMTSTKAPEDLHQQIITHFASLVECINLARFSLSDVLEAFVATKA